MSRDYGQEVCVAPASFAQHRLWLMEKMDASSSTYNIQFGLRFRGEIDHDALCRAVTATVRRHELLRTTFELEQDELVQVIAPAAPVAVRQIDFSRSDEPESLLQDFADAELRVPFDLETGPLMRPFLVRLTELDHVLLIVLDHLVCDAWSLRLLHSELTELYAAFLAGSPSPLPELDIQYADFASWQRETLTGEELDRQLAYWRRHLQSPPDRLELPTSRPRGLVPRDRGASDSAALPADVIDAAERLATDQGASLFTVLLAAFSALLWRYSGQPEHVVGSLVANRTRTEIEGLVGFFTNTVALRMDVRGEPNFRDLLSRTRDCVLDAYANQEVPFDRVVEDLRPRREPDRQPFFDVMMQMADLDRPTVHIGRTQIEPVELASEPAPVDLILAVIKQGGQLVGVWDYDVRLFDLSAIRRMQRHYLALLRAMVSEPDTLVSAVPLVGDAERRQLLNWGLPSATDSVLDPDPLALSAALYPDEVALADKQTVLQYRVLDRRVNQLTHHLLSLGVGPETIVGLALDGVDRVVAELAVLRAGGLVSYLDDSRRQPGRCRVVVTSADQAGSVRHGPTVVLLDMDEALLATRPTFVPRVSTDPDAGAFLLDEPDHDGLVMLTYRAMAGLIAFQREEFTLDVGEVVPLLGAAGSTSALFETLLAFGAGARLEVPTRTTRGEFLRTCDPAVSVLTPVEAADKELIEDFPSTTELVVLGNLDALGVARRLAEVTQRHVLGVLDVPAGAWVALRRPSPEGVAAKTAMGLPYASASVYVLDDWFNLAPPGVRGELCVGGGALARGLLGRPGETALRYLPDPFGVRGSRLYRTGLSARWTQLGVLQLLDEEPDTGVGDASEPPAAGRTAPRSPFEQLVADVWREVLQQDDIAIEDDFFDLGGHSLLASQIRTRLRREFDLDIPIRALFESPSLGDFAAAVLDFAGKEDQ